MLQPVGELPNRIRHKPNKQPAIERIPNRSSIDGNERYGVCATSTTSTYLQMHRSFAHDSREVHRDSGRGPRLLAHLSTSLLELPRRVVLPKRHCQPFK